jgi:hypothetical protein
MMKAEWSVFLTGAFTMGYLVTGGFFWRFWRRTRDGLFRAFACAFVLLATGQAATAAVGGGSDGNPTVYLFRLAAFVLILLAIWAKNGARSG